MIIQQSQLFILTIKISFRNGLRSATDNDLFGRQKTKTHTFRCFSAPTIVGLAILLGTTLAAEDNLAGWFWSKVVIVKSFLNLVHCLFADIIVCYLLLIWQNAKIWVNIPIVY